jgi:hypothetical protein
MKNKNWLQITALCIATGAFCASFCLYLIKGDQPSNSLVLCILTLYILSRD